MGITDLVARLGQRERDVRVLDTLFDSSGERWRTIEEILLEMQKDPHKDWPMEGPRTIAFSLRQLRRQNESWLDLHEWWVYRSCISSGDRSIHEHKSPCRVLYLITSYDQLNLSSVAGAEANCRRALIEHAYSSRPYAPDYSGSIEFFGNRTSQDGTLVAKRQGRKAEILKSVRLSKEEALRIRATVRVHFRNNMVAEGAWEKWWRQEKGKDAPLRRRSWDRLCQRGY